ncbi:hypothetical protein GY45DRAFT_1331460 [Cubamyces sp. BRFM 1775]|nr:hypothetical protein GY45DRAFT_1331460 [Cubamyces sp. BRFM 1775]
MPLPADLAAAFQHIATVVSDLDERYFDTTIKTYKKDIHLDGRKFEFLKLGYSKSAFYAGIGYEIKVFEPSATTVNRTWNIWIDNPSSSIAVNRKAVVGAIQTIIEDPNTAKVSWTVDAGNYADTA